MLVRYLAITGLIGIPRYTLVSLDLPLQRCPHVIIGVYVDNLRRFAGHVYKDLDLFLLISLPLFLPFILSFLLLLLLVIEVELLLHLLVATLGSELLF